MKTLKIITVCASCSFGREMLEVQERLKKLGFKVRIPKTVKIMKRKNDFQVSTYKTWFKNKDHYQKKTELMIDHFKKVIESDAILVVNYEKNSMSGYIGGNTLMEMVIAFHYKKPIFILNEISEDLAIKEEVFGLKPIFIKNDLQLIIKKLKINK